MRGASSAIARSREVAGTPNRLGSACSCRIDARVQPCLDMCVKLVLVAALLVLASGCGGSDQAAVRVPSSPYPGAGATCPTAEPSPISVSMARAALREHGFTVAEADGWCGLDLISAMLT